MTRRHLLAISLLGPLMTACAASPPPTVAPSRPDAPPLVPLPASVALTPGATFAVTPQTPIAVRPANDETRRIARVLAELIAPTPAALPPIVDAGDAVDPLPGTILLALRPDAALGGEGYDLTIASTHVTLTAPGPAGLFYGVQTIRQLLPVVVEYEAARRGPDPLTIPAGHIRDVPRFAWRGAMLDVARHFFDVADVQRYIDLLALHKFNRLHLHLSDDQGWRIDIPTWPGLARHGGSTEVGGGPGGYYTTEQYAAIVAYARDRYLTVVPEIDMPGHTNAALASYAHLNCDGVAPPLYTGIEVGFSSLCVEDERTWTLLDDVIRTLAALTPGPYLHVGGDEVKTLTAEQYRRFIERVQDLVQAHGKRMVGWDEVAAASLAPGSVVQHWRPKVSPALVASAPAVIMSPADRTYVDMKYDASTLLGLRWAGLVDVRQAYDWDPAAHVPGLPAERILGVEAPLWSETLGTIRDVEYMAFPRVAAIAEVGWSRQADRAWEEFAPRLAAQAPRWTALGVNFHRSIQVPW